jgi:enoyl-CoA hydratase
MCVEGDSACEAAPFPDPLAAAAARIAYSRIHLYAAHPEETLMNDVRFDVDGPICIITLNRPERRNAVDGPTAAALHAAFARFAADDALGVAILTGAGGHFCAGADLKVIDDPALRNAVDPAGHAPGPMGPTRMALPKPLIAAIAGHAVAGGLELALMADLRVVEQDAIFGVFCRRWGVPLIDGGTVRLPRIVGMGRALDMILTGRAVDAEEARQMGLANYVVPTGESLSKAIELAHRIAAFPRDCLLADRRSAYAQWDLPLADALRQEGAGGAPIVLTEGVSGAARFNAGQGRGGRFSD